MCILVTGGCGFIGSAVVRNLITKGQTKVVNVDKMTYAATLGSTAIIATSPNYVLENADICDREAVLRILNEHKPTAIIHLAAESHVDRSIDSSGEFIHTNIVGTWNLLEASRSYLDTIPNPSFRFIHVSTDEVFGALGSEGAFTETTPYQPNSPYSASKAASDHLVRAWHHTYGLPSIITNCSNNYGPYQYPEKLIPVVISNALSGIPIPVYGDGLNVRDWLFVDDHARALITILEHGCVGETYNIGGGNESTNIDLVRQICRLMDKMLPESDHVPHESLIHFVGDRLGHDWRYAIDATKLREELGWSPETSLSDGLRETVSWYLANGSWLEEATQRLGKTSETEERL